MDRTACLIFNPIAGQGDSEQDLATIKACLEPEITLDIQFTTKEIDAGELARQAVKNNARIIIASGGDGTVSAVTEALIGTDIALGVISRGTANAFANAIGIPTAIEAACENILAGSIKKVDATMCNDKPMVLLAGIGFEAETIKDADRETKDRLGMLAYVLSGLKQLQNFKIFTAEIETEDKVITVDASAVTIANAAPPSSVLAQGTAGVIFDDGLLDITILAPQTKVGAIATSLHLLQTAANEEAANREGVGYLRAKWVKVTTNPPQRVVLDGEIIGKTPIEVKCLPKSLNVFAPIEEEVQAQEQLDNLPGVEVELK